MLRPVLENIPKPYLLAMTAGVLTILLGVLVLFGWHSHNTILIQVSDEFVPMQYNTALGFILSGVSLLFIFKWRCITLGLGIFVSLIGLLTLFEYIFAVDFNIDQLLIQHYITTETSYPGRMAPNTALCFLLIGTALTLFGQKVNTLTLSIITTLGSLVVVVSMIALIAYVISYEASYGWGGFTRMAVHTATGFMLLGLSVSSLAWRKSSLSPSWFVIPIAVFVVIIMSYSLVMGSRMANRHAPMQDAVMEMKFQAAIAHLWFEEIISGDRYMDITNVWKSLDESAWYAQAMLDGGKNKEGTFIPLTSPLLRNEVEDALIKIEKFRKIAEKRWKTKDQSGIGTRIDQHFDALFEDFIQHAEGLETQLKKSMSKELYNFRGIQIILILLILILSTIVIIIFLRYERRQRGSIESLQNNEVHMRAIFNTIPDLIWLKDINGVYLNCNPRFERLYGAKQAEIVGKTDYDYVDQATADFFRENDKAAMTAKIPCMNEEKLIFADDGHSEWVETIKAPIFDNDGKPFGVLGLARDITERKQKDEALQQSSTLYHQLIDNMSDGIAVYKAVDDGADFVFLEFNQAGERISGVEDVQVIGRLVTEVFPGIESMGLLEVFQRVWKTGQSESFLNRLYRYGQIKQWFDNYIYKLPGGEIVVIYNDITELKQADQALRESEARFRQLFEKTDAISVQGYDSNRRVIYWNPASEKTYGYTADQAMGKQLEDLIIPETMREQVINSISNWVENGQSIPSSELTLQKADGSSVDVFSSHVMVHNHNREVEMYCIDIDLTEHKRSEIKLKAQFEELRRWHEVLVGREGRNLELKAEINVLLTELGRSARYSNIKNNSDRS